MQQGSRDGFAFHEVTRYLGLVSCGTCNRNMSFGSECFLTFGACRY